MLSLAIRKQLSPQPDAAVIVNRWKKRLVGNMMLGLQDVVIG